MMKLADDLLVAEDIPPKLAKAMAVVATRLHQTFDITVPLPDEPFQVEYMGTTLTQVAGIKLLV
jgi:hypothetical protein